MHNTFILLNAKRCTLLLGNTLERSNRIIVQLNNHFKFLMKTNKQPGYKIEDAFQTIVKDKPYRIMHTTSMLFKVIIFQNNVITYLLK